MTTARTIDCHTHVLTEQAMRLLAKQSPKVAPKLTNIDARGGTLEIDGKVVQHPIPREIWDLGLRLRDMDANDVDLSLIHISEPTRLGMISYAVFCLKK